MPELTYPLERAQAFAASEAARAGDPPPPSLVAFRALVDRYREFVDTLDRVRRERTGPAAREALAPALAAVEGAAETVRAALHDAPAGSASARGCPPDPSGASACPADRVPPPS